MRNTTLCAAYDPDRVLRVAQALRSLLARPVLLACRLTDRHLGL